jgi:hypothetical protein
MRKSAIRNVASIELANGKTLTFPKPVSIYEAMREKQAADQGIAPYPVGGVKE